MDLGFDPKGGAKPRPIHDLNMIGCDTSLRDVTNEIIKYFNSGYLTS
jgi:hypothetical protein